MKRIARFLCLISAAAMSLLAPNKACAQSELVEASTDFFSLLPSATAAVLTIIDRDEEGFKQLALGAVTAIGISYGLEASIKKDTPDGDEHHAFPSTHTMAAFNGASFLMGRYGWKWGVPAYVVSTYVAWGRIHCRCHDIWDVLGGAAIGAGCAFIFTRPRKDGREITVSPAVIDNMKGLYVAVRF